MTVVAALPHPEPPKLVVNPAHDVWDELAHLECAVSVEVPVPGVKVDDMLHLSPEKVLNTQWRTNRDLPLWINGRPLGMGEFEGGGEKLGIRITEFAWEQDR